MASTTMPSNKCEPTVFDIKKHKDSTPVRRWFHILKQATFKNPQNHTDSLKVKVSHESSAPCSPHSSTTEGESDATRVEDPKEHTGLDGPSSTAASKPKPTTASESLPQTLLAIPESTASPDTPQVSLSPCIPTKCVRNGPLEPVPPKTRRIRRQRKPTMITPELLQQIQTSNRKHSGPSLLNGGQPRTKALGTATATNRAKDVVASPLRWFEK